MKNLILIFVLSLMTISAYANPSDGTKPCMTLANSQKICIDDQVVGGGTYAFGEGSTIVGINKGEKKVMVKLRPGLTINGESNIQVLANGLMSTEGCLENNLACVNDQIILAPSLAWSPTYPAYEQFFVGTKIIGVNKLLNRIVIKAAPGGHFVGGNTIRNLEADNIFVARGCIKGVCAGDIASGGKKSSFSVGGIVQGINKQTGEVILMSINADGTTYLNGQTYQENAADVMLKSLAPGMDEERAASEE